MILTSPQVAERLGVSVSSIYNLVLQGRIRDLHANKPSRHKMAFDSEEIQEFRKIYKRQEINWETKEQARRMELKKVVRPVKAKPTEATPKPFGFLSSLSAQLEKMDSVATSKDLKEVESRLAAIEEALSGLIKLWS